MTIPLDIPIPSATKVLSEPQMMLAVDLMGNIHILLYHYYSDRFPVEVADIYWYQLDINGQLSGIFDLSGKIADGSVGSVDDFLVDGAGNAFVNTGCYGSASGGTSYIVTPDGEIASALRYNGIQSSLFANVHEISFLYQGEASNDFYLADIDLVNESLDEHKLLDIDNVMHRSVNVKDIDILSFAAHDAVYDYSITNRTLSQRFTWTSLGIAADSHFTRAFPLNGKRVLFFDKYPYDKIPYKLIRPMTDDEFTAAKENKPVEKSVITVALNGALENQIKPIIYAYNMANPDKQVELINYFDNRSGDPNMSIEDWYEWGFKEQLDNSTFNLELDIIRRQGPDVVISRNTLPFNRYAKLGIFEDLNPWLGADNAFNWADYYAQLIRAYEIDGKLYGIPVYSFFKVLIVRQSDFKESDKSGWNIDEFIAFVDSFASDHTIFVKSTKTSVLDLCLYANGGILFDWNSQDAGFNRDFVTKILEFANRFIDDDKYFNDNKLDLRAQNGEIKIYVPMLTEYFFPGTLDLYSNIMGEPVSYIGYPSENGSGIITHSEELISLTAECRDKEAAWHFISYYLAERLHDKDAYKKSADSWKSAGKMTSYDPRLSSSYYYQANDNEIASYFDLLMSDVQIRIDDQIIENIIKEEAGLYFSGSKSLDEVVDVIENRVRLYASELK